MSIRDMGTRATRRAGRIIGTLVTIAVIVWVVTNLSTVTALWGSFSSLISQLANTTVNFIHTILRSLGGK